MTKDQKIIALVSVAATSFCFVVGFCLTALITGEMFWVIAGGVMTLVIAGAAIGILVVTLRKDK